MLSMFEMFTPVFLKHERQIDLLQSSEISDRRIAALERYIKINLQKS